MIKLKKKLLVCVTMNSFLLLIICSQTIAATKTADIQRIKSGYLLSDTAMRDVVAGWKADHEAVAVLRQGIDDLQREFQLQAEDTQQQLAELKHELAVERKRYNAAVRRSRGQGVLIGVIIGAVVGTIAAQ